MIPWLDVYLMSLISLCPGMPSRHTISNVAEALSSSSIATVANEIGLTTDRLNSIKRMSANGQGEEHTEIINSFFYAADDLPMLDKLVILTDALIYVDREDLLIVLFPGQG